MGRNKKNSKKIKKTLSKIAINCLLFLFSFSLLAPSVYAWDLTDFGGGDVADMAVDALDSVLNSLGVDKTEFQYKAQTFNVSRQKKIPPQVSLTFTPLNPSPGKKITATAMPTYFLNSSTKDLYFTWFLKSKDCERTNNPSSAEKAKCDLNGDGRVDIADYKIKAMRIIANNGFDWESADYSSDNDSDGYKAPYGGNDQSGKSSYCYVHDTKSGDEYQIECDHLFPHAIGEVTGDNSFGRNEEKFWHTDPHSTDTAGTGNPDEANVVGLGINQFTWNYEAGDEVGVVVEGVSIEPTQTADASYRTMWAMPKRMCDISTTIHNYPENSTRTISVTNNSPNPGQTTTVTQTTTQSIHSRAANIASIKSDVTTTTTTTNSSTGSVISQTSTSATPTYATSDISSSISVNNIPSASDLNQCLYDNLINPAESEAQGNKLDVSLSYSPQSPVNDPSESNNGDELIINSSVNNAEQNAYLHYFWQVYQSNEINPDSWGKAFLKSALPDSSQTTGIGLNTFKFKLNLPHPQKYLRVKLTVTEKTASGVSKQGHSDVVIPIASTSNQIKMYPTAVSNSLNLSMGSSEICQNGADKALCPVFKNEIIGLRVSKDNLTDFLWTIDGKPFTYQTCFFDGCDINQQTNVIYFPVLKNKGERYVVNLNATNQNTGEKIKLSRTFKVTDPQIKISPVDETTCKPVLLGQYVDLNGKSWPDHSKINFQALSGQAIRLEATTTAGFSVSPSDYVWNINGNSVTNITANAYGFSIDNNGILTLPPKDVGESYNVSAGALYSQSDLVKQALNKYWNVSYGQLYEKPISDKINITIADNASLGVRTPSQKIMASIYSAVPSYLAFLLKIVLTTFIILIGAALILSLFPKIKDE